MGLFGGSGVFWCRPTGEKRRHVKVLKMAVLKIEVFDFVKNGII